MAIVIGLKLLAVACYLIASSDATDDMLKSILEKIGGSSNLQDGFQGVLQNSVGEISHMLEEQHAEMTQLNSSVIDLRQKVTRLENEVSLDAVNYEGGMVRKKKYNRKNKNKKNKITTTTTTTTTTPTTTPPTTTTTEAYVYELPTTTTTVRPTFDWKGYFRNYRNMQPKKAKGCKSKKKYMPTTPKTYVNYNDMKQYGYNKK